MDTSWLNYTGEALLLTLLLGWGGLPLLRHYKARQSIREEGPKSHRAKRTDAARWGALPAAGSRSLPAVEPLADSPGALAAFHYARTWTAGFLDDFIKAELHRNLGLTARQKMTGQILLAVLFCYGISATLHMPFTIAVPFSTAEISIGWFYYPFVVLVIVGASNAVNLTDGLDGLAAGCSVIAFGAYFLYSYMKGMNDIAAFSLIMAGCCMGFLFFNYHPAKVFMGDTGSLALGGAIAGISVLTKTELLLVFLGMILSLKPCQSFSR